MQEMFTHRLAVSNQPRLAKQLLHLGLHHVKCFICHYDICICGKLSELTLAPAPHGCCVLHVVRRVLCTSASANSACCIQSVHIVCFPQVRSLRPHTMPAHHSPPFRTASAHGLARDSLSAAPTIYKLAHPHLIHCIPSSFCLFNTPSHIKHCSTYSITYNESDHTNSSEPVEGSQGSQS